MSELQQSPHMTQLAPLVEDASIREIYADSLVGIVFNNGNINTGNVNNINVSGNGGCCYGGGGWNDHYHPIAAGVAVGAAVGITAAVVGSMMYTLPRWSIRFRL